MTTAPLITAGLNAIVLALTPIERWGAARRFNPSFVIDRWFVLAAVIVLIILAALLIVVSLNRTVRRRRVIENMFFESADKAGLSERERQVMLDIAAKAGLKQSSAIFTMSNAFERGIAKMIEKGFGGKQMGTARKEDLRTELTFLREKLGFRKPASISAGSTRKTRKLSSRQIPVGKKMYITRRKSRQSDSIECTVIKNDEMELVARLSMSLESEHGEAWLARYYFGASVWEFDTSVINSYDDILVLSHSNNIRFINRRRFLRVPVSKPAFIARFPFTRTSAEGGFVGAKSSWGPPEFVSAVITEFAGPGLRIEAGLDVEVGDRVLVVFSLDEEQNQDSDTEQPNGKMPVSKVVEDMGEVRHIRPVGNGLSIAVELTGLSDSDVNELIRATNAASLSAGVEREKEGDSVKEDEGVVQPSEMQGV